MTLKGVNQGVQAIIVSLIFILFPLCGHASSTGYFIALVVPPEDDVRFSLKLLRDGIRYKSKRQISLDSDTLIYTVPSGRYTPRLFNPDNGFVVESAQTDLLKPLRIKRNTLNYLGSIRVISVSKFTTEMKISDDISALKQVCKLYPELFAELPLRFLLSDLPKKEFKLDCPTFKLSEFPSK